MRLLILSFALFLGCTSKSPQEEILQTLDQFSSDLSFNQVSSLLEKTKSAKKLEKYFENSFDIDLVISGKAFPLSQKRQITHHYFLLRNATKNFTVDFQNIYIQKHEKNTYIVDSTVVVNGRLLNSQGSGNLTFDYQFIFKQVGDEFLIVKGMYPGERPSDS